MRSVRRPPVPSVSAAGSACSPRLLLLLVALAILLGPGLQRALAAGDSGTATFHGNAARTGQQPGPAPRGSGKVLWRFQTGDAVRSSPILAGGVIYFGSNDGNVYAVNAKAGEERWRFATGGAVRSTPAVADGVVYVGSDDGYCYAIDAAKGKQLWRFQVGRMDISATQQVNSELARRTITASPVVVNGLVLVPTNDFTLHAVDAASGIERWHVGFRSPSVTSPAVANGSVYVGTEDGVYAVDLATGHIKWQAIWGLKKPTQQQTTSQSNQSNPNGNATGGQSNGTAQTDTSGTNANTNGGNQTTGTDQGSGGNGTNSGNQTQQQENNSLAADLSDGHLTVSELMDTEDGKYSWAVTSSPVVVDNFVYAAGFAQSQGSGENGVKREGGMLLQLDVTTGEVKGIWNFKAYNLVLTTPAVVDGAIYLGNDRGMVFAVDANITSVSLADTGTDSANPTALSFAANQERWGAQTEAYVGASAAVVGDTVITANAAGNVYALETASGKTRWQVATDGAVWSSPAVVGGVVYIGSDDGFLYAIGGS